jgi:hypothetical protein
VAAVRHIDAFEWVTLVATLTMCLVMLVGVGQLYRRNMYLDDRAGRVRALTWMLRGMGLLQVSIGLHLASTGSWVNAPALLLMGTLFLFGAGPYVRFTHRVGSGDE